MIRYILDEDGKTPIAVHITDERRVEEEDRVVGLTVLGNGTRISTVFLQIDHQFPPGAGKPVLWETMVFDDDTNTWDEFQERYTSYDDALVGHNRIVKAVINNEDPNTILG